MVQQHGAMLFQRGMALSARCAAVMRQQQQHHHHPRRVVNGGASGIGRAETRGRRFLATGTPVTTAAATGPSDASSSSSSSNSCHVSLVQGASRGIGLEMVRQLLERPDASLPGRPAAAGGHVVATCRDPLASVGLAELQRAFPDRLTVLPLDVTDVASIKSAAAVVKERHGRVDLMANTAAVLHVPGEMSPETSIARIDENALIRAYRVNAMGPVLVVQAFAPLLMEATARNLETAEKAKAAGENVGGGAGTGGLEGRSGGEARPAIAIVANLSARVSSIGDNGLGGWYSYRASKTALNQLTKNMAIEFGRKRHPVSFILLHPGTVDTGLSAPFQRNVPPGKLFTVERAASQLLGLIGEKGQDDTGKFFAWDGSEIEW